MLDRRVSVDSSEDDILSSDGQLESIGFKMENEPYCPACICLRDKFYQRIDVEDPDFDYIRFSCSIC